MIDRARAVVIGGGVGGCSIAYWLARPGWADTVLVERAQLTSGSTFHSAGLVGQLRGSLSLTRMMMNSVEFYRTLGDEVDLETGWREVGSLRLASTAERMEELQRQAAWAETFGLPLQLISAERGARPLPADVDRGRARRRVLADRRLPRPEPAHARAGEGCPPARRHDADRDPGHRRSRSANGAVRAVETDKGRIECEVVVNAGGIYAHEIGRLAGVHVPLVPMAHQYVITKPADLPRDMPTLRDPSMLVYFRGESGGLVTGGYERNPSPWASRRHPARLQQQAAWNLTGSGSPPCSRPPSSGSPTSPTPRSSSSSTAPRPSHPTASSSSARATSRASGSPPGSAPTASPGPGGMGRLMAEWIVEGQPGLDTWEMDSRRFGPQYRSRAYTLERTTEVYATYYDVQATPATNVRPAGRFASPAYPRLDALGAAFGEKSGWERVNWFESNAGAGDESLRPTGWAGRLWSPAVGAEHLAVPRDAAALFDETSFSKLEVVGPGAAGFLESHVREPGGTRRRGRSPTPSSAIRAGGVECDLTVTRSPKTASAS